MQAKECAEIYNKAEDKEAAISEIAIMFLDDTSDIIKKRNLGTSHALQAVLKEQSDKWKAFCRQIGNDLVEDGFSILVKQTNPELTPYLPEFNNNLRRGFAGGIRQLI